MSDAFEDLDGLAVARALVLGHELVVAGVALRVEEAEAYFFGPGHRDPFAHRHPAQSTPGRWYFHRAGARGGYRGGTYQGLDLTFGPEGTFGGVLIRTVSQTVSREGGRLVSGPSLVVDHLRALAGAASIAELDDGRDARDPRGRLWLRPAPRARDVLRTARVGLTLKRPGDERPRWLLAPHRLLTEPRRVAKGRVHTVVALHEAGWSAREIRDATGAAAVERWLERYARGLAGGDFEDYAGRALTAADYAALHGIWTRRYGSDTIGA